MSRTPTANIDYTSRDYEAYRNLMIEKLQEKIPEYTDTSETDAGIVIIEALANGLDILSLYSDIIANDVLLPTTKDRKMAVLLAKNLGYIPYNQTASEYQQVFVLSEPRTVDTIISKGTVVKTKASSDLATIYYETMDNLTIPSGALGDEKDENDNYLYSVRIQQGSSVYQDVIGSSSGAPLQSFKLNYTNVLVDTIELYINEGDGKKLWKRVDSFLESDETSRVYTVSVDDFDVCTIEFGNGIRGKIPSVYSNGISANYRVGGGEAGNVGANIITELDTNIAHISSTFNLEATIKGHEKESIESIKENAPAYFRTRDRIVTLQDYSDTLRIGFYDFLCLNTIRDDVDKKLVHIYYMMRQGYELTPELVEKISKYIAERSMIGTTYDLIPYTAREVNMECVMYVDSNYDKDQLVYFVNSYLEGVTFLYGNLKFGDTIVKSDLENEIKETFDGILSFRINTPTDDIITPTTQYDVLTKGTINIDARYL